MAKLLSLTINASPNGIKDKKNRLTRNFLNLTLLQAQCKVLLDYTI